MKHNVKVGAAVRTTRRVSGWDKTGNRLTVAAGTTGSVRAVLGDPYLVFEFDEFGRVSVDESEPYFDVTGCDVCMDAGCKEH